MTSRTDLTGSYTQAFDVENRLTSVTKAGLGITSFAYDAAGIRVKTLQPDGTIIYTPFPYYEETIAIMPTINVTANGQSSLEIAPATPFTLTWDSTHADSCAASGAWTHDGLNTNGTQDFTLDTVGTYTFTITCENLYGAAEDEITVTVLPPTIEAFTSDKLEVNLGESFTLSWNSQYAQDCLMSASGSEGWLDLAVDTTGSLTTSSNGTRIHTLTCANGTFSDTKTVTVAVPKPTVSLFVNNQGNSSVYLPADKPYSLNWYSENAVSCTSSWPGNPGLTGEDEFRGMPAGKSRMHTLTCSNGTGYTSVNVSIKFTDIIWSTVVPQPTPCHGLCPPPDTKAPGTGGGVALLSAPEPTVNEDMVFSAPIYSAKPTHLSRIASAPTQQGGTQVVIQRSTYSLAGQTIAVRVSGYLDETKNGLFYLYSDHPSASSGQALGSVSTIQNPDGTVEQARYLPFGGYRTAPTTNPSITDRGFTGQKHNDSLGLIYYNARFYVPGIGRFASADTIVPDPTNPQEYNRYSYTLNNPLKFTDPSGHWGEPTNHTFSFDNSVKSQFFFTSLFSEADRLTVDAQAKRSNYTSNGVSIGGGIGIAVGGLVAAPFAATASGTIIGIPAGAAIEGAGLAGGGVIGGLGGGIVGRTFAELSINSSVMNDLTTISDSLRNNLTFSPEGQIFADVDGERLLINNIAFSVLDGVWEHSLEILFYGNVEGPDGSDGLDSTKIIQKLFDIHGDTAKYLIELLQSSDEHIGFDSLNLDSGD